MPGTGIDACAAGWVAVEFDPPCGSRFRIAKDIGALALSPDAMVYIDIPIGLPETGDRGCDRAARLILRGAAARVFLGLRRPLLRHAKDYSRANAWAKADGKGLSRQAFALLPKIAEIDAFLTPQRQRRFRESHPELVFCRLNEGTPLASKHAPQGLEQRRAILKRCGFGEIDSWLGALRGSGAQPDDLLDASALALAAFEATHSVARRVETPIARDAKGFDMAIWF